MAPADAHAQQQANQAQRQALEQAIADGAGTAASEARPLPARSEHEQAQEVWLRRVPDQPGALLRRRLLLEQERRQWQR